ncbi:glycosyltransferase [Thermotoga sp. KOL6]|uniref:glycosyltransferase n=1 Tax=Thermotoga sp. KOL6 TaxID=126741 RepID=UPI000C768E75|nr:glycosyltransferase [Thermotoga sp. KOL6]PLV59454.1 glycosyl transferase family 1 [Thermotoga sp. KOL6]
MTVFDEIKRMIEKKEFSKAKKILERMEDDAEKYNTLGIICYYEGNIDEASNYFRKALELNPVHDDALFNYSKVLFEKGLHFESWRYLTRINRKTWEIFDMLGDTQLRQNNLAMALHYYHKAVELSNLSEMKNKYETLKNQLKKALRLAIFCLPRLDNFIKDIVSVLSEIYEVEVVVTTDGRQIADAYNRADIVWIEWANEMAIYITNNFPKNDKKVICRLHSYEALGNYPEKINWTNVDTVVLVADHIESILKAYHENVYKKIREKIKIIPNGVNLNRFKYTIHSPGFNIAVVANINYKKAPEMWLQVIGMLKKIDERYTLHVAGGFQDLRYLHYFKYLIDDAGLRKNVRLYGFVKNVNEFLEDKNYLLSTSIHESFGYNIAEAMARGIKPIIHNYAGSKKQWPKELVYNYIHEIPRILNQEYSSDEYRKHIELNYSLEKQIKTIYSILI